MEIKESRDLFDLFRVVGDVCLLVVDLLVNQFYFMS